MIAIMPQFSHGPEGVAAYTRMLSVHRQGEV